MEGFALEEVASSTIREIDERLEDLTATIEYKDSAIGELRQSLRAMGGGGEAGEGLHEQIATMSLPVARRVLRANVARVLELRVGEREAARRDEVARLQLSETTEERTALRQALRQAGEEHERQLCEVQASHAARVGELAASLERAKAAAAKTKAARPAAAAAASPPASPMTPEHAARTSRGGLSTASYGSGETSDGLSPQQQTIEQLGRDNFYYKQTCRQLKRRLREASEAMIEGGATGRQERVRLDAALHQVQVEQQTNARLLSELGNLKAYLTSHPGATPTRVGKKTLREIEPSLREGSPPRMQAWGEPEGLEPEGVAY